MIFHLCRQNPQVTEVVRSTLSLFDAVFAGEKDSPKVTLLDPRSCTRSKEVNAALI